MKDMTVEKQFIACAEQFVREYGESHAQCRSLWRGPQVGFADALDPAFVQLKEKVIPGHLLPTELLDTARSVAVIFVPFSRTVIDSNTGGSFSSALWDVAYRETNLMLSQLNACLCEKLELAGYRSTGTLPPDAQQERLTSRWSHRHIGVISGIGTFGINNMLITDRGSAGRLTSLVTEAEFTYGRPAAEKCLYKKDGSCLQCMAACPMDAIGKNLENIYQVDKTKCAYVCYDRKQEIAPEMVGGENCGKCSCGVACSCFD